MKYRLAKCGLLFLICAVLCLPEAGCGSAGNGVPTDGTDSVALKNLEVNGECLGGESDQYIVAEMTFDREIQLSGDLPAQLRAVIGGKRIAPEDIAAEQTGKDTVRIRLHVDRVTDGVLKLTAAPGTEAVTAVTEAGGTACLRNLDVEKIVPSGVTIHEEEPGCYAVDSMPTHRSIVWIRVRTEQGIVTPGGAASTDIMDEAAAVHEHEFLWATKSSVAEDIAETVKKYYGPGITAEAKEDHVILRAADGQGTPALEIYEG